MGLYYQSVMDKSKLIKANRLYNKIENLKKEIEHVSRFEMEGKIQITNSYDSYFHIDEDMAKTYFPMIKGRHGKGIGGVRAIIFWTLAYF